MPTAKELSMQDKTMQGFLNALENLPMLINVFTGKTSMLLRQKPTDSEEKAFLDNLKIFLAANAKALTDMLLWMLPNEIEVGKINIDKEAGTGKIYFDSLAKALSEALLEGKTGRPMTESKTAVHAAAVGTPKIEFEVSGKSTDEVKEFADKLRAQFDGEYELSIKVKM